MKTMTRYSICVFAILVFFFASFSAYGADVKFVTIGTAVPGGTYYVLGIGMADVINKTLEGANYKATAITTGGALENSRLLGDGKINLGLINVGTHSKAYLGQKPFKKEHKDIRMGFNIGVYILHFLTIEKTGIKSINDLKGKTISLGTSGSIVQSVGKYLLGLHGIKPDDVKIKFIGPAEAVEALTDGIIDAFAQYAVIPSPAVMALAAREKPVLIACDRDKLDIAQKEQRYLSATVPGGTYKGQTKDVPALGVIGTADFNKNDSADFVYQITKAVLENTEPLKKIHPVGGMIRLLTKEEGKISAVPFHPGAVKYAAEKGVKY
ncbi:MAG: TAXI family TRAP transporter solute-binding subunit [Pseudomonadota bacterium]